MNGGVISLKLFVLGIFSFGFICGFGAALIYLTSLGVL